LDRLPRRESIVVAAVDFLGRAGRGRKQLGEIADAKHTGGITAHPAEYEHRAVGFFDRNLAR
jgi:hypothetical protein